MKKIVLFVVCFMSFSLGSYAKYPTFLIKHVSQCPTKVYGGGFLVKEVIHPKNDGVNPGFSTAYITLKPHTKTNPHKLTKSSQVYFILKGRAILHIGNKTIKVSKNTAVYIAPGVWQWAENPSNKKFVFLCIVAPPWYKAEEIVKR